MPIVEIKPETLDSLRGRYAAAMTFVYDAQAIIKHGAIRPGEVAAQVFDFEDGVRIIAGRQRGDDGCITLHFTASFGHGSPVEKKISACLESYGMQAAMSYWLSVAVDHFRSLSGFSGPATMIHMSQGSIPHFVVDDPG